MKKITLTQGFYTIVDNEDFERLNKIKWYANINHCGIVYAVHKDLRMNRVVMGAKKGDGRIVDHINCNSLDNRRSNLRFCSNQQNCLNSKARKGSSQYKGVTYHKKSRKWQAQIHFKGKHIRAGSHDKETDAARAYDEVAIKLGGKFARTNF